MDEAADAICQRSRIALRHDIRYWTNKVSGCLPPPLGLTRSLGAVHDKGEQHSVRRKINVVFIIIKHETRRLKR